VFLRALALVAATTLGLAACQTAPPPTKETSQWWSNVSILASDRMAGRLTGSQGYDDATRYVADQFRRFGLEPAGADGYFQPVAYEVQSILADQSQVTLRDAAGNRSSFAIGDDLVLTAGVEQPAEISAPLVFIGYGLHLPEIGIDDFAGVDLHGKIVLFMAGAPPGIAGPLLAYARAEEFAKQLAGSGAVGALNLQSPTTMEIPWDRLKQTSGMPGLYLSEPDLRRYRTPTLIGTINPAAAGRLFEGSGQSFQALAALADAHQTLPHFPLAVTLMAQIKTDKAKIKADNVVAELPGSDPKVADEAVVLSAHLDHLGTGRTRATETEGGDGIYPGAMDNASGVASLLEIARLLQSQTDPAHPGHAKRSILFVAFGGEEEGLLGSRYFAAHPSRHVGELAADINIDMFLPIFPLHRLTALGAEESSLGEDAKAAADRVHLSLTPDLAPEHLLLARSDQFSFIRRGVPAMTFDFAPESGAEQAALNRWFTERYHGQGDRLDQPVDLAAAEAYDRFLMVLVERIANANATPTWRDTSYFKRFASTPLK
jgi:Zn-dependent M28 family amino/carboxypeptidase